MTAFPTSGIMEEPRVDIEVAKDTRETAPDGPIPSTQEIDVYSHGIATGAAGRLGLGSGGATDTLSWTDAAQNESTVTLDTRVSKVRLPIVGGYGVAVASGGFAGS